MALITGKDAPRYSQNTVDQFAGNGSTTSFALSRTPPTASSIFVTIDGVKQHTLTYSLSFSNLIFSEAPPAGSSIEVIHLGILGTIITPSDNSVSTPKIVNGAITSTKLDTSNLDGTGAVSIPSGTTEQRPSSPVNGMIRNNTTTGKIEMYQNGEWVNYSMTYTVEYLVVAGGGAGGASSVNSSCGGGGAGGYISGTAIVTSNNALSIVVGAGGSPVTNSRGYNGNNSTVTGSILLTSVGGGGGGGGTSSTSTSPGADGGSGGGSLQPSAPGNPTSGQGYAGGYGSNSSPSWGGGGGGGAGGVGQNGTATLGGPGGPGKQWLNGSYYAGGGGGATYNGYAGGAGGIGGGGAGGSTSTGYAGTANTGGGGGAGSYPGNSYSAAQGGSGVVIFRYLGVQKASGGTVTQSGGYTYHTFTTSGTFNP